MRIPGRTIGAGCPEVERHAGQDDELHEPGSDLRTGIGQQNIKAHALLLDDDEVREGASPKGPELPTALNQPSTIRYDFSGLQSVLGRIADGAEASRRGHGL